MLPHVETPNSENVAACCDRLLAERGTGLLSMKDAIAVLRQRTGTDRSDADLAGLVAKKAALAGVAIVSDNEPIADPS